MSHYVCDSGIWAQFSWVLWLTRSHKLQSRCWGTRSSKGLTGMRSISKLTPWFSAGFHSSWGIGLRASVCHQLLAGSRPGGDCMWRLPYNTAARFISMSKWERERRRAKREVQSLQPVLGSNILYQFLCYPISFTRVQPTLRKKESSWSCLPTRSLKVIILGAPLGVSGQTSPSSEGGVGSTPGPGS